MPLTIIDGPIIQAGEALSAAIDCSAGQMVRITCPAGWTPANMTFQISTDGLLYNDYFDRTGHEIMMAVVPGTAIGFDSVWSRPAAFIKFRSGTRNRPKPQAAIRQFAVTLEVPGP